jgi:pyrroline-5-carboxylate reductase
VKIISACIESHKEKEVETIGFIGAGNMAEALIKGVINAKLYAPENVLISDIRDERLRLLTEKYGVISCEGNDELAAKVETVVLSIKPQNMTDALESIKDSTGSEKLVISIAAGIKVADIAAVLGDIAIVRVMPNTPALIGEGAGALLANERAKPMLKKAVDIFSAVGKAVVVEDEDSIDAVTALSGSGPAYYFLLMEEMIKSGIRLGLPDDITKDLVLQTAKGAGLLAVEADKNGESPAILRRKVTSPGGTTEAAIEVFKEGKISELISAAINRAYERSRELSE